jgi:enoyl-CoA hydratase/carnithine racemase
LLVTNRAVSGVEAVALGLANHVTAGDDFAAEWRAWVRPLAHGPRDAMTLMKENVRQAMSDPWRQRWWTSRGAWCSRVERRITARRFGPGSTSGRQTSAVRADTQGPAAGGAVSSSARSVCPR